MLIEAKTLRGIWECLIRIVSIPIRADLESISYKFLKMNESKQAVKERSNASLPFQEVVRLRKSCRAFLPQPVSAALINAVLEDAQLAPSNWNLQPWNTHIVSGNKLKELSEAIARASTNKNFTPDFSFDENDFYGEYLTRSKAQGKVYYESLGIARGDEAGRKVASDKNMGFFGAPHVALLFMPSFGDDVRVAGDIGMYRQTFLLSLVDHGLAGIPQTFLGMFASTIRKALTISDEFKMMFGISFGYADPDAPGSIIKMGRDPISKNVTFHQ